MLRTLAIVAFLVGTTSLAAAKRVAPPPAAGLQVNPGAVPALAELATRRSNQLVACAVATSVKATVRVRFGADRQVRTVTVKSRGGRRFERCVATALRGQYALSSAGRGVHLAVLTFAPISRTTAADLRQCSADADCTLHFQTQGCFAADPVALNQRDPAAIARLFPIKREACAMGGPQYERLRMSNEGRYQARCVQSQCTVLDRGPQNPSPL